MGFRRVEQATSPGLRVSLRPPRHPGETATTQRNYQAMHAKIVSDIMLAAALLDLF